MLNLLGISSQRAHRGQQFGGEMQTGGGGCCRFRIAGVRPWQIRAGVPQKPAISVDARIIAHEPAGLFTDVIATRADGRALRARLPAREAQELPTTGVARFHIHEEDIHIFAAPWPGRRIR